MEAAPVKKVRRLPIGPGFQDEARFGGNPAERIGSPPGKRHFGNRGFETLDGPMEGGGTGPG